jgi:hypothetical protein
VGRSLELACNYGCLGSFELENLGSTELVCGYGCLGSFELECVWGRDVIAVSECSIEGMAVWVRSPYTTHQRQSGHTTVSCCCHGGARSCHGHDSEGESTQRRRMVRGHEGRGCPNRRMGGTGSGVVRMQWV